MELFRKEQSIVLGCFAVFLLLNGCGGTEPECDSLDTRNSVVKTVSDDNNNALVNYAVKNSSLGAAMVGDKSETEKSAIWEKARQAAVYRLDDTILTNSRNRARQEVTCIGLLSVTVADVTAQKEIEFKVKQTADAKSIVSVNPFLF
jgi:flagellar basal body-associated protein FliL